MSETLALGAAGEAEAVDLVVIGTGSGGSASASKCRAAGWRVVVVDDQPYGGTCAVRGCDPKKVLVGAADVVSWHRRMQEHGIGGEATIEWPELMHFKRSFTDPVPANREAALEKAGIETLHGDAHFVSESRVAAGERLFETKHVVIAAGAGPRALGIPGEEHVTSSTEFLELDSLPSRIAFVGVGYISLEFAHIARRAGAKVVAIGRSQPLRGFDADLVERLLAHSREIGIDIRLGSEVTRIERDEGSTSFRVHTSAAHGEQVIEADLVVHGAGRVPNTGRLATHAGGVKLDPHGAVAVNEFLQSTTNPRVYAAGDVVLPPGSVPLTPVAGHEGAVVASNLLRGNSKRPDYRGIASVVFTIPALASVGLTERAAREQGLDIRVKSEDTAGWYTNRRVREPAGMYKTIVNAETDHVLGAHLLGQHVDEVINIFALAVRFGISATELRHMIYAYPTGGSDVSYMI